MMFSTGLSLTDSHSNTSSSLTQSRKNVTLDHLENLDDEENDVDDKEDDNSTTAHNNENEDQTAQNTEKIIAASLGSILQYEDISSSIVSVPEARRRRLLTLHILRFAAENMARINVLANLLATLFFQDLVVKNLPVPPMVVAKCQIFWSWTVQFVTTENGQLKPTHPLALKSNPKPPSKKPTKRVKKTTTSPKKELKTQEELDELNHPIIEKNKVLAHLTQVFNEQFKPCLPRNFQFPPRDCLSRIINEESIKRRTTFKNLYSTTFFTRQEKVVRDQIQCQVYPAVLWIPTLLNKDSQKELRWFCTNYVTRRINTSNYAVERSVKDDESAKDCISNLLSNSKNIDKQTVDEMWNKLKVELECLILMHIAHMYITEEQLENAPACISEKYLKNHGYLYVHYFAYLWHYYKDKNDALVARYNDSISNSSSTSTADTPETKREWENQESWKLFPIVPQMQFKVGFIDIDVTGILDMVNLSLKDHFQVYLRNKLTEWEANRDWLNEDILVDNNQRNSTQICNNQKKLHRRKHYQSDNRRRYVKQVLQLDQAAFKQWCAIDWVEKPNRPGKRVKSVKSLEKSHTKAKSKKRKASAIIEPFVVQPPDEERKMETITPLRWYQTHKEEHFMNFFPTIPPLGKNSSSHYSWLISTDGQQVRMHTKETLQNVEMKINSKANDDTTTDEIDNKLPDYFTKEWQEKVLSWLQSSSKTIISVDPGHVDLITAVRHLPVVGNSPIATSDCYKTTNTTIQMGKKAKRRRAREQREREAHQTTFTLSNKCYYELSGFTEAAKKNLYWRKQSNLTELDTELSRDYQTTSCRTFITNVYQNYIKLVTSNEWWLKRWQEQDQLKYRKLRFYVHQKGQKVGAILAKLLCQGDDPTRQIKDCIILWGAAKFGATTPGGGHAPAPNKKMRRILEKEGVYIILVSEYLTSQRTACCHKQSKYAWDYVYYKAKANPEESDPAREIITKKGKVKSEKKQQLRGLLYCHCLPTTKSTVAESKCKKSTSKKICTATDNQVIIPVPYCHHRAHHDPSSMTLGSSLETFSLASPLSIHSYTNNSNNMQLRILPHSRPWRRDICSALCIYYRFMQCVFTGTSPAFSPAKAKKITKPVDSSHEIVD